MADSGYSADADAYDRIGAAQTLDAAGPTYATSLVSWTNVAGALVSLSLIAGVGIWGYDLMMRDVSGLPVVRAAATEMRVRPDDPGGQLAIHQGLTVNEIAAQGGVSGPVDSVKLAPPAVALAQEDQPVIQRGTGDAAVRMSAGAAQDDARLSETAVAARAALAPVDTAAISRIVAELTVGTGDTTQAGETSLQAQIASADAATSVVSDALDTPGLRASVRPRLRPAGGVARVRPVVFTPGPREIDPAEIPPGTRLAQLGAFNTPEIARMEWDRMQGAFGGILDGKSRVVQEAVSSGRVFYRLRAMGFVDLADARRFCSAVKAESVDCIPVEAK